MRTAKQNAKSAVTRTICLDEHCTGPFTPETGATLLQELVKFFLFMRGQIPGTFDDLCWHLQVTELKSKRVGRYPLTQVCRSLQFLPLQERCSQEFCTQPGSETPAKCQKLSASEKKLIRVHCQLPHCLDQSCNAAKIPMRCLSIKTGFCCPQQDHPKK